MSMSYVKVNVAYIHLIAGFVQGFQEKNQELMCTTRDGR